MNKWGVCASTIEIAIDGKPYGIMQTCRSWKNGGGEY